jgi:hypothetical protein
MAEAQVIVGARDTLKAERAIDRAEVAELTGENDHCFSRASNNRVI